MSDSINILAHAVVETDGGQCFPVNWNDSFINTICRVSVRLQNAGFTDLNSLWKEQELVAFIPVAVIYDPLEQDI